MKKKKLYSFLIFVLTVNQLCQYIILYNQAVQFQFNQVVVLQSYRNNSDETMEAKYVFPIDQSAAVCGFEAFINDKHVVGVVKEKEKAHKEYRQAVEAGHGAYLMDEESPVSCLFIEMHKSNNSY